MLQYNVIVLLHHPERPAEGALQVQMSGPGQVLQNFSCSDPEELLSLMRLKKPFVSSWSRTLSGSVRTLTPAAGLGSGCAAEPSGTETGPRIRPEPRPEPEPATTTSFRLNRVQLLVPSEPSCCSARKVLLLPEEEEEQGEEQEEEEEEEDRRRGRDPVKVLTSAR